MPSLITPGVYLETVEPEAAGELLTGVPAFLGYAEKMLLRSSLDTEFQCELKKAGPVSEQLRNALENRGISLSSRASLTIEAPGSRWRITDNELPRTYVIQEEQSRLKLYDDGVPVNVPQVLTFWQQFEEHFGPPVQDGFLAYSIRGFFENGGQRCYAVRLDDGRLPDESTQALRSGLQAIDHLTSVDLVGAPDIMSLPDENGQRIKLQAEVLKHCDDVGDRVAILDSLTEQNVEEVLDQRGEILQQRRRLVDTGVRRRSLPVSSGANAALYYPWLRVRKIAGAATAARNQQTPPGDESQPSAEQTILIPPCGHVAGVYSRTDRQAGVHKAPANETLEGVVDLETVLRDVDQEKLNPEGVNALRVFPGRGIRVWGARTLIADDEWRYVNVRRVFLTLVRWIELNMADVVFEPNDPGLWADIRRDLGFYLNDLFEQGALKGATPEEAFFVKCDEETNPPADRDNGLLVTEIGLAVNVPAEFIVVRIIQSPSGVSIAGPG